MEKLDFFSIFSSLPQNEDYDILQNQYLFETLKIENHNILDFDLHLKRAMHSLRFFNKSLPIKPEEIYQFLKSQNLPYIARLRLNFTAHNIWGEISPLPNYPEVLKIGFDPEAMIKTSITSRQHKTSDYHFYTNLKNKRVDLDEIIFVNEREEITETTRANLFYYDQKRNLFITPPLSSGLLPGIERQKLLTQGFVLLNGAKVKIKEEVLLKNQVSSNSTFLVTNSLMGIRKGFIL